MIAMGLEESLAEKGMHPGAKVQYRSGLAPKWLADSVFRICYPFPNNGKLNLLDSTRGFGRTPHSDWYSKLQVVGD